MPGSVVQVSGVVEVALDYPDAVIVGCDSMLHIDGELVGKSSCADREVGAGFGVRAETRR
ncbi:MAG: hypothetical protein ACRDRX_21715 [Pseudonocardiaceae bacterium]